MKNDAGADDWADAAPVVIVTVRAPSAAIGLMEMFTVACVALLTVVLFTTIPAPKSAVVVPLTKFVNSPVTITLRVAPCAPEVGLTFATTAVPPPGLSAARTYDSAYSDYAAGQYELAISGFQTFLKFFPRHMSADDAQLNIGNSLYNGGQFREAVTAYQRVISDYAGTDSVPAAHYKLGQTYMALKQNDLARKQFETLMQAFPRSNEATLGKQALDRIK